MLLVVIRSVYAIVCIGSILALVSSGIYVEGPDPPGLIEQHRFLAFIVLLVISQLVTVLDLLIPKKRVEVISAVYFGLLIGFLLSYMLIQALSLGPPLAASATESHRHRI